MRTSTPATRLVRSLTALLTVWCLGCNAFDPLIGALVGDSGSRLMVCASEGSGAADIGASSGEGTAALTTATSDDGGREGVACGCDSCHATAATLVALATPSSPHPQQPPLVLAAPPGIELPPLVPPPQHTA